MLGALLLGPAALTAQQAPRVCAWTEVMEDLSGLEPGDDDWCSADQMPESIRGLLGEVGHFHAPFLLANADAIERGAERVEAEIAGQPWVQKPFSYQKKCLTWLRESHARLDAESRSIVDGFLAGTGCEALFA